MSHEVWYNGLNGYVIRNTYMIENYAEQLNTDSYVSKFSAADVAIPIAKSISSNQIQSQGEGIETVYVRTLEGYICELGIHAIVGGEFNKQAFDYRTRSTYAWDIKTEQGHGIEVKCHKNDWFTISRSVASTLINNIKEGYVDLIVTSYFSNDLDNYYTVHPRLIIDPKTFKSYLNKSKYSNNFYYSHLPAIRSGDCIDVSNPGIQSLKSVV